MLYRSMPACLHHRHLKHRRPRLHRRRFLNTDTDTPATPALPPDAQVRQIQRRTDRAFLLFVSLALFVCLLVCLALWRN